MHTLYGIKNCDTVKKAKQWLDQNGVAYQFHDFRTDGLTLDQLNNFTTRLDWNSLLNRNSTSWRQLSVAQQSDLTVEKVTALMLTTPTLIKRPILDTGDKLIIGFTIKDDGYAVHLPKTVGAKPATTTKLNNYE
jgi:arsenate reductase